MGKRELILLAGFFVVGLVIYHATAPPAAPGEEGFSLGRLAREIRGMRREGFEHRFTASESPGPEIRWLVLHDLRGTVRIVGGERADIGVEADVTVFAPDKAEADRLAAGMAFAFEPSGDRLALVMKTPAHGGRWPPQYDMTIEVPHEMRIAIEELRGSLDVQSVAAVRLDEMRGDTRLYRIDGAVEANQRDGRFEVSEAGSVDVTTRRAPVTVEHVDGGVQIEAQDGRVRVRDAESEVHVELRRGEVEVEDVGRARLDTVDARVTVRRVRESIAIESDRSAVTVTPEAAIPVKAIVENGPLEILLPDEGVTLDLRATEGDLRLPPGMLTVNGEGRERHASGEVGGGGPPIQLETLRGDLVVRGH